MNLNYCSYSLYVFKGHTDCRNIRICRRMLEHVTAVGENYHLYSPCYLGYKLQEESVTVYSHRTCERYNTNIS